MSSSLFSLLWWVVIGLMFFWMMSRGGCGMGHAHGGTSHRAGRDAGHTASSKPVDPVCGMELDPAKAADTRVVGSEIYFFCSQNCLDAFDKMPGTYAPRREEHAAHHGHAGC